MGPYDEDDAARDTNSSRSDVDGAWHNARSDDQNSDDPSVDYGDRDATYADAAGNEWDD